MTSRMTSNTTPLDPLTLPLRGSRLIEASAGTGKTWTIAALMVRLVLGHGQATGVGDAAEADPTAPPRPMAPGEVLVMTFTRAATRELSERIRGRLLEAARFFRGEAGERGDDFLQALRHAYPETLADGRPGPRRAAAHRLALAAEAMDDAAVHTIDAWCQRMLREHAFDSAQLFDEQLEPDEAGRRREAVHDYWRQQVYPLHGEVLDAVLSLWPDVDALAEQVQRLLPRLDVLSGVPAGVPLGRYVADLMAARAAELAALKAGWVERADRMAAWIAAHRAGKEPALSGANLKSNNLATWFGAIRAWAVDPVSEMPTLSDTAWARLTPAGILACLNEGREVAVAVEFEDFERLHPALSAREPAHEPLLRHAAHRIAARLAALKRRAGRFGYADLSERLDAALHGPQGEVLAQRIRTQFPVALVDEFQDTSPLQYRLFERIYRPAENRPDSALLLIGDPKQSIYGFRGADIYSYLDARATTAPRHHALGTNHRSTVALVGAVNAVFAQAQAQRPTGAFALGVGLGASGRWALPFEPVGARGRRERFVQHGADVPALTWACLPGVEPARALRRSLADHAAARLVDWLGDTACGWRDVDAADDAAPSRRLRPGDVAVLVRNLHEAEAIGHALARRGVHSVYLSDQDSVFASPEAADLLRWLQAVAEPLDSRLARAAYAGATWNLPLAELAAHVHDDALWDRRVALLQRLHAVWQRQGVLAMLRQTLHALALPQRWLGAAVDAAEPETADESPDSTGSPVQANGALRATAVAPGSLRSGERRLTNLLHLGELLQSAAARLEGEAALIRWLAAMVAGGGSARSGSGSGLGTAAAVTDAEAQVVRLESDAQLVQIVTVHKSKGLEYPVVMLPFAHGARTTKVGRLEAVEFVDADGRRGLDFRHAAGSRESADAERLREDLRLFYVALTRARHAVWLGVGVAKLKAKTVPWSALAWLVAGDADEPATEPDELIGQILGVAQTHPAMTMTLLNRPAERRRWHDDRVPPPLRPAQTYRARFDRRWGIGSFSALVRDLGSAASASASSVSDSVGASGAGRVGLDRVQGERLFDETQAAVGVEMTASRPTRPAADAPTRHRFPRGAQAGNFLHDQLQWLGEEGFERATEPAVAAALQRRCERAGHAEHAEGVVAWLQALLSTALPPLRAPLAAVGTSLPEMEFWLPAAALPAVALDRICRAHLLPGAPRPALAERTLRGLLMGFADLVFEHGGRWWVMDYKSNALGADDAAYTDAAMQAAMLDHRYELQAALYLLALHRLLRQRLGAAYDPARQLGGAVYLFLRGIDGPAAGCVHLPADPVWLDALDAAIGGAADGEPDVADRLSEGDPS